MPTAERSILIIRYSSIGDVILIAPLIAQLRRKYPDAYIALLTYTSPSELFRDDKRLSRVFAVKKRRLCNDPILTEKRWDLVADLQNNRHSTRQTKLLNYEELRRFDKLHAKRTLLLFFRLNRYSPLEHIAARYIRAGDDEVCLQLDYSIPFIGGETERFREMLQQDGIERPVAALMPFCAWKNKEWREKYYITLGHFFIIKGWNVVILGGKADRDRAERMRRAIGHRSISLAGRLSLYECGCVLRLCSLALGGDTGLSHLARACGIKTGFIFGPTTEHFGFMPEGDEECRVFERQLFCRPCHPHGGNFCWRLNHACMAGILPDEVICGLMDLFHG